MTAKFEYSTDGESLTITRVTTVDRTIVIPGDIGGVPVTGIGEGFLSGCPGGSGRTLVIPASVTSVSSDALEGSSGIVRIEYGGDLSVFCSFKLVNDGDCELVCRHGDRDFDFMFIGKTPMSFPEFDDSVLSLHMRLTLEIAVKRLGDPIGLTEENRGRYMRFISDRVMPRAEQAVAAGDTGTLEELFTTGMVSDDDLRRLLERSLRSGRIGVTSMLMTEIRKRV